MPLYGDSYTAFPEKIEEDDDKTAQILTSTTFPGAFMQPHMPAYDTVTGKTSSHELQHTFCYYRWLPEEKQCMPDICSDLQLGDVPDLSGFLPASLFCAVRADTGGQA